MAVDLSRVPIRMCAVVLLENGKYQAFCIACGWEARPANLEAAAERIAKRHSCRKRGKKEVV